MLTMNKVTKKFGSTMAVDNCELSLEPGKIYGLLGPNGSGKSTWMKMVSGLLRPSDGEILIDGDHVSVATKSKVAFMPTEQFLYKHLTIKGVGKYYWDFYSDFDMNMYLDMIKKFDLKENLKVKSLSTGMHAKLKVAATLSRKAKYIMLDEPLNGIDLIARDVIMKAIIQRADENNCVIISSHFVEQMEPVLDQVIFIKEGKIVLEGDAEMVRSTREKSIVDLYREVYVC